MKLMVDQSVFKGVLAKAAIGALTEESQGDSSNLAPLIKSVKLSADSGTLSVESYSNVLCTRVDVAVDGINIDVGESGTVVVQAKELLGWVTKQPECKIGLRFMPESETAQETQADGETIENKDVVRKVGTLKIASKDNSKTGSKWSLESYDTEQLPNPSKPTDLITLFNVADLSKFKSAISSIESSAKKKDDNHVCDGFVLQTVNGKLYAGASDGTRCAIYDMSSIISDVSSFFETNKIIIPLRSVQAILGELNDENLSGVFEYSPEKHVVYFTNSGFSARLLVPDLESIKKFPSLEKILSKQYNNLASVSKVSLNSRLSTAAMVNKFFGLFVFKNSSLKIYTATESGLAPNTCDCPVMSLDGEHSFVWNIGHLFDAMKVIKDNEIVFSSSEDGKTTKLVSITDPNISLFIAKCKDPKYDDVKLD